MPQILRQRSPHSGQLERWIGKDRLDGLSYSMRDWYGRPISLLDVPGSLKVMKGGDYAGTFKRGMFFSAMDALEQALHRAGKVPKYSFNAGFTSISDALSRASGGFCQRRSFFKAGTTGVVSTSSSLWRAAGQPGVGATPGNAPGGTAFDNTTAGALGFANPAAGGNRLVSLDGSCSVVANTLLVYDAIFGVNKTMNSTATEAVTGVPTRYQSVTATDEDYAGDNFLFIQVGGTALAGTGHNWTVCTYTDQDGNTGATLPTVTGVSSAIVDRFDDATTGRWFCPLAAGDSGIKALTQMQCSAAVATGVIWFMMGHPLGFCMMPALGIMTPVDFLTNRDQTPRVFNGAGLGFIEVSKPTTTATNYSGRIAVTATAT